MIVYLSRYHCADQSLLDLPQHISPTGRSRQGMSQESEAGKLWKQAKTLEDMGELMARRIEGRLLYSPFDGGETVDPETGPLIETLAFFNKNGLLTTNSQPSL